MSARRRENALGRKPERKSERVIGKCGDGLQHVPRWALSTCSTPKRAAAAVSKCPLRSPLKTLHNINYDKTGREGGKEVRTFQVSSTRPFTGEGRNRLAGGGGRNGEIYLWCHSKYPLPNPPSSPHPPPEHLGNRLGRHTALFPLTYVRRYSGGGGGASFLSSTFFFLPSPLNLSALQVEKCFSRAGEEEEEDRRDTPVPPAVLALPWPPRRDATEAEATRRQ